MLESGLIERLSAPEEELDGVLELGITNNRIIREKKYWMSVPDLGCRFTEIFLYLMSESFAYALIAWIEVRLIVEDVGWSWHRL